MPRDIRELRDDPAAYAAELRRRWGGLLSYRYLGRHYASMDLGAIDDVVALRRDMRDPTGGLLLAVLGIVSPEGGGMSDLEAVPNPVIHSCQVLDPGHDVTRIEIRSETLKRGRQLGFSRSLVVDADEPARVLALTEGQGIAIGTPPEGLGRMPVERIAPDDGPGLPPLWQVFGASRRADGAWQLPPLADDVASPDGALHLGPQFVVLEAAARTLAAEVVGTDALAGTSSHVMFLARGKTGPFRVAGEASPGPDGAVAVRTILHDEGAGDRPVTAAAHVFREQRE